MSLIDLIGENEKSSGILGVVTAIVTNNKDPAHTGRVKLKFPDMDAIGDSDWARIATLMSGKERGTFFIPEVGDEVLVGFDNGDIHHPYVLGSLWNGKDVPPANNDDGKNDVRMIKSRNGHEIILNDNSGKERIEIKSKSGHSIILDDTSGSEKVEFKDKGGNSIVIDSVQNDMTIQCSKKLKIKAKIIEIEADSTITIQGAMVKIN